MDGVKHYLGDDLLPVCGGSGGGPNGHTYCTPVRTEVSCPDCQTKMKQEQARSLRQQAREAACPLAKVKDHSCVVCETADASSDQWEALLREVIDMAEGQMDHDRLRVIKEALDG